MAKVTKLDALNSILASLSASSGEIEACAVVSADGLMMASNFPAGMDEDRLGGMTAALLAMGERTSRELSRGELEQVYVRGKNGLVILMGAGQEGVLAALCSRNAKLGLIFLDMARSAQEIARVI
ncbi:MAG: roadblock/LC7 domain-containing protein [Verrucomicrobiales bacterium]|nr:roadblock/LC7 domain-containing protein [Verrucomicrobiales bacterium]